MAGPVAAFAAEVQSRLREIKGLTLESAKMEKQVARAVRDIDKLRAKAADVASPHLAQPMTQALDAVRRAADAVQEHVLAKNQHTPHEYRNSLAELDGYLAGKLDQAIGYFATVERSNPSALRRPPAGRVISMPVDDSSGYAG